MNTAKYLLPLFNRYLPKPPRDIDIDSTSFLELMSNNSGSRYNILSGSSKFRKGQNYLVKGVYLDPHFARSVCAFSASCKQSCLINTGHMPRHQSKRYKLTLAMALYPEQFFRLFIMEIAMLSIEASFKGVELAIRFNGTSDIRIEKILDLEMMKQDFPNVIFYDYTKYPLSNRYYFGYGFDDLKELHGDESPKSYYHLTYSIDEQEKSIERAKEYLSCGFPVAIVLSFKDYKQALSFPFVIDGEENDHRFLQGASIVVLRAKTLTYKQGQYAEDGIIRPLQEVKDLSLYLSSKVIEQA